DLQSEWETMLEASQVSHPLLRHIWLRSWWESFGAASGELRIILVREDGRLVAAAPLCLNRTRFYGIPARILESIYNAHTPRFEFPMCTARQDEVHALLWKTMADIPCDAIVLKQFPSQSATLAALQASASASGWCTGTTQGAREPF